MISSAIEEEKVATAASVARSRARRDEVVAGCLERSLRSEKVFGSLGEVLRTVRRRVWDGYFESMFLMVGKALYAG